MAEAPQVEASLPETKPSNEGVLRATVALYEAALLLRGAPGVTAADVTLHLQPAMAQVVRQLQHHDKVRRTPAVERVPSVIQQGPDFAADVLRGAAAGADVQFFNAK